MGWIVAWVVMALVAGAVTLMIVEFLVYFAMGDRVKDAVAREDLEAQGAASRALGLRGLLGGVPPVLLWYALLAFVSPSASLAYWSVFAFPFVAFAKLGEGGARASVRLMGRPYATFNQRFLSGFTSGGFITGVLVQLLRYLSPLP